MDAIEAIRTRRSIRSYEDRPVDRDQILQLIEDAAHAPPPFAGGVPWMFTVLEGVGRVADYGERAMAYAREHRPPGPGWDWTERDGFKVFWNAPAVVIISGPVEDCCRAGQTLLLAAHARGLGACWVGAPLLWLRTPEARTELGLPMALSPVAVICLGHAAEAPVAPARAAPAVTWTS